MNKIQSFTIDHTKLVPGIYISRKDGDITTFDMRMRTPNAGDYLDNSTMHTFEHMFASFIRNSDISEKVIYFGPMGCQTGFYLLVSDLAADMVLESIKQVLNLILSHDGKVFGASKEECGNYQNLNLELAKIESKRYLQVLNTSNNTFLYL